MLINLKTGYNFLGTNTDIKIVEHKCHKSNIAFNSYLNSNAYSIICPECGTRYNCYNSVLEDTNQKIKIPEHVLDILIGTIGILNGIQYLVIGYAHKRENGTNYYWHEYTLFNPIHGQAYLSLYNGHWIYLKELSDIPLVSARILTYQGVKYDLFSKYKAKLVSARGEFVYRFSPDEIPSVEEFVRPGEMISKEQTADNITWYKGEYIEPGVVKKVFDLKAVPERKGVGMIQPFIGKFNIESFRLILGILTIIWGIFQFYFHSISKEEIVYSQSFNISDSLNKKEIYTKPFDLKYGTTNAEIKINTDIDNNWLYTAVTLVNEKTGDIYDLDLEAQYYHGYEDGGYWSEGENWVSKVISQVPEGRYYLIIYSEKPSNVAYVNMNISVARDVFVFSNGLLVLIILAIFPAYYFYKVVNFEKERWYNSNYSPYGNED